MTHNQSLQQIRHILDLRDSDMLDIFTKAGASIDQATLRALLSRPSSKSYQTCSAEQLGSFLDGLIVQRRGPSDAARAPLSSLSHNTLLKKLRIALCLQETDLLRIFAAGGRELSRYEVGALFRKPENKHFKACDDALLGQFFKGLEKTHKPAQSD